MWDRLLTNCNVATMDPEVPGAFGAILDGAIGIQDGRIVRVGRRIDLAGYRAQRIEPLGGAWVTPGLIDCHTHLVFGGNRAGEFEQRLKGPATRRSPAPAAASARRSRRPGSRASKSWSSRRGRGCKR
jgi:imidazolonepropionase